MRGSTEQSIRAAWARLLELDEEDLQGPDTGSRTLREVPAADSISFVRIFDRSVLSGPRWALDRAGEFRDGELALLPVLMGLASDHGARPLGAAELSYTDARVEHADLPVTQDEQAVVALEAACSDEDVEEVGLSGMPHRWVLLEAPGADRPATSAADVPDPGPRHAPLPLAGSGYVVWADTLAHMGVLTSPKARGRGYGVLAAAVGTNAALDAGLVPQWRARWDNEASKRLAQVLEYEFVGTQTTVLINPQ